MSEPVAQPVSSSTPLPGAMLGGFQVTEVVGLRMRQGLLVTQSQSSMEKAQGTGAVTLHRNQTRAPLHMFVYAHKHTHKHTPQHQDRVTLAPTHPRPYGRLECLPDWPSPRAGEQK